MSRERMLLRRKLTGLAAALLALAACAPTASSPDKVETKTVEGTITAIDYHPGRRGWGLDLTLETGTRGQRLSFSTGEHRDIEAGAIHYDKTKLKPGMKVRIRYSELGIYDPRRHWSLTGTYWIEELWLLDEKGAAGR